MKVPLIILGVLFLIGCIPVGVLFRYHDEIELKLTVLCFRIGSTSSPTRISRRIFPSFRRIFMAFPPPSGRPSAPPPPQGPPGRSSPG